MVVMREENWKGNIYRQQANTSGNKECKEDNFIWKVFIFEFSNKELNKPAFIKVLLANNVFLNWSGTVTTEG